MSSDRELLARLERAVESALAHVAPAPQDLGRVRAKARAFRRRRAALRAAAVLVLVLAAGAAVPVARAALDGPGIAVVDGDPTGAGPLGLWLDRDTTPTTRGLPSGNHTPGSSGEVAAQLRMVNGKATITAVGEQPGLSDGTHLGPAPTPSGGLATVGLPPKRGYQVVVVDAAGQVVSSKPLPAMRSYMGRPMPVAASDTGLYWWQVDETHPVYLTYDFASGKLTETVPASAPAGYELPVFGMQTNGTRVVQWPAEFGRNCSFETLDAATGERVARLRPEIGGCTDAYFALSPDSTRVAALVTDRDAGSWSQKVYFLDATTGEIQGEYATPALAAGTDHAKLVYGLDWAGDKTVRYARGVIGGRPVVRTLRL